MYINQIILQFDIFLTLFSNLVHHDLMNAKTDSGTPPQKQEIQSKQKPKKEAIVNRLTCATLEGVNAQVIEEEDRKGSICSVLEYRTNRFSNDKSTDDKPCEHC